MQHKPNWLDQAAEPLFPEVLWSQPVNKRSAGSLLIVGGHATAFSMTQNTYTAALKSGAGRVKVVLPQSVGKLLGRLPDCEFLPATPSGSLARNGLETLLGFSREVDAVLLPGELSANTETVGLLESFLQYSTAPIIATDETIELLLHTPTALKPVKLFMATALNFSKLAHALNIPIYVKKTDLRKEASLLTALSEEFSAASVLYDSERAVVRANGQTSVTRRKRGDKSALFGTCATFYIQHANKFEALTTAIYQLSANSQATNS